MQERLTALGADMPAEEDAAAKHKRQRLDVCLCVVAWRCVCNTMIARASAHAQTFTNTHTTQLAEATKEKGNSMFKNGDYEGMDTMLAFVSANRLFVFPSKSTPG
jgi:hypothetical protein